MATARPNYGITRIDQPEKKNHGYYVRITHKGKGHQKYFPDKASGGKSKALKAAKEHRDKLLSKMPKYKQEAAAKKKRRIKQSGVTGVTHVVSNSPKGKTYQYWQAAWVDGGGKRKTAKFSISRYGNDKALDMAKKARRAGLRKKN
ncbi:MAG: AP2 domain-containing protein [Verrucomicrobiales bacterium]|nr:AP2 domain-containing protein [Verrucomicrobiales bacterium]